MELNPESVQNHLSVYFILSRVTCIVKFFSVHPFQPVEFSQRESQCYIADSTRNSLLLNPTNREYRGGIFPMGQNIFCVWNYFLKELFLKNSHIEIEKWKEAKEIPSECSWNCNTEVLR